jgi:hypothetical protein
MSASPFDYLFHTIAGYLLLFLKPLALIILMDAAVWWDLDVSLSKQETSAMLILFMDTAVGWVLDVSLSEQQTCAIYVDNVHGRCHRVGPRCQPL